MKVMFRAIKDPKIIKQKILKNSFLIGTFHEKKPKKNKKINKMKKREADKFFLTKKDKVLYEDVKQMHLIWE